MWGWCGVGNDVWGMQGTTPKRWQDEGGCALAKWVLPLSMSKQYMPCWWCKGQAKPQSQGQDTLWGCGSVGEAWGGPW